MAHQTCSKCGTSYPLTREFWGHNPSGTFRKVCRVCTRAANRKWNRANKDKQNERSKRYQAKKKLFRPTEEQKVELWMKANGICRYCGVDLDERAQVDHEIPVSKGGSNDMDNLDLICPRCNQEKSGKTPEEYAAWNARSA